jgi:YidC/Oxa1 family membrane protein insertase
MTWRRQATAMVSTFTGPAVFTETEKYQKVDFSAIADNKAKFAKTADNGWLAMVQHYFVAAGYPRIRPRASSTCAS